MSAYVLDACVICGRPLSAGLRLIRRTCEGASCRRVYREHLEAGRPFCSVCGRPLATAQPQHADATCGRLACRREYAVAIKADDGEVRRCCICRVLLAPGRDWSDVCHSRDCGELLAKRQALQSAERRAARLVELARVAEERRSTAAAEQGVADPEAYALTVIPSFSRPLVRVGDERVERFRRRLMAVVHEALAAPLPSGPAEPSSPDTPVPAEGPEAALNVLASTACAMCRGKCCREGGDHAYLSAEAIRRFAARHADWSPQQVLDAYLELIPQYTFAESCIYHGERGCALPALMRSATCNDYFCEGLTWLRDRLEEGAAARAFFVSAREDEIVCTRFTDIGLAKE